MTLMLASVRSQEEAEIALAQGADIIDCKEPSHGALAALALSSVYDIVQSVKGRRPVSAVVELPYDASHARHAFEEVIQNKEIINDMRKKPLNKVFKNYVSIKKFLKKYEY